MIILVLTLKLKMTKEGKTNYRVVSENNCWMNFTQENGILGEKPIEGEGLYFLVVVLETSRLSCMLGKCYSDLYTDPKRKCLSIIFYRCLPPMPGLSVTFKAAFPW